MSKKAIDFTGAKFERGSRHSRHLSDGTEVTARYEKVVTLWDGTIYSLRWPEWNWAKWLPNKEYRYFGDTRGWYRKVNDRYAKMLNNAWSENFVEPTQIKGGEHAS